jgi:hypothetical protein
MLLEIQPPSRQSVANRLLTEQILLGYRDYKIQAPLPLAAGLATTTF